MNTTVAGATCTGSRARANGDAHLELQFPVVDEAQARVDLAHAMSFVDSVFAPIIEFEVEAGNALVVYDLHPEEVASRCGNLAMDEVVRLTEQLLVGLEHAHAQGLGHPGLTVDCVRILTAPDGHIAPQVIGLGLPIDGQRAVDEDLVDVAALAYQLATGQPAHMARDEAGHLLAMAVAKPGLAVPPSFESMVRRALAGEGFLNAGQMRQALMSGERPNEHPTAPPEGRAVVPQRRRKTLWLALVGLGAGLAARLFGSDRQSN